VRQRNGRHRGVHPEPKGEQRRQHAADPEADKRCRGPGNGGDRKNRNEKDHRQQDMRGRTETFESRFERSQDFIVSLLSC
jgi:hypothetical protein